MASQRKIEEEPRIGQAKATALVVIALLVGFWAGYLYRGQAFSAAASRPTTASDQHTHDHDHGPASQAQPFGEHDLQVHLAVLKKDPRNRQAMIQIANIYYDSERFAQAIPYYTQALEVDPSDVNVRTDLGTAFWYSGKPQEAVEQFHLALKVKPAYPQTLFNLGIVRLHGLSDPEGAISAWEQLLAAHPGYPEAAKVRSQIEQARALLKVKSSTP